MKDFLKNYKIPIILGALALVAVIATVIVITGGSSSRSGLYITSANGNVSITNDDVSENAVNGAALKQGDVITVGTDSSCTIAYRGKKNSEDNSLIIGPETQVLVSDEFNGKDDGELFVRNGTVIGNFAGDDRASVIIRTSDSTITLEKSVSKISYYTNEFISYTDLYTFMGNSEIQLYDSLRNPVNSPEIQIQKKWGRVVSENAPSFEALNLDFDLSELTVFDLRNLITIAQLIGDDFPYRPGELQAALDSKKEDSLNAPLISEPPASETDNSDNIQTAEPISTETTAPIIETTLPGQTTAPHVITTAPPQTTAATNRTSQTATQTAAQSDQRTHTVTIIIDGEETIQEVAHGQDAVRPEDPVIDGYTFMGWDGSFENITEDTVITAIFRSDDTDSDSIFHTVTVVIGENVSQLSVPHGQSANLPTNVEVDGYIFRGWDKDFTSITSDITITAILEKAMTHTVTFVVENQTYTVQVEHGGSAMPPYIPSTDSNGNRFLSWDKSLGNIINDTTITAVFASDNYHTVTFIIDNQFYQVKVEDGGNAEPPFWPMTDSNGNIFVSWDRSLNNITSDVVITAIYGGNNGF